MTNASYTTCTIIESFQNQTHIVSLIPPKQPPSQSHLFNWWTSILCSTTLLLFRRNLPKSPKRTFGPQLHLSHGPSDPVTIAQNTDWCTIAPNEYLKTKETPSSSKSLPNLRWPSLDTGALECNLMLLHSLPRHWISLQSTPFWDVD
jgi:hypothetical protein